MAERSNIGSIFNKFLSLFLLLLHLGCFIFTSNTHPPGTKKRKRSKAAPPSLSPSPSRLKPHEALSSSWSYIKRIFCSSKNTPKTRPLSPTLTSARSFQNSLFFMIPAERHQPQTSDLSPRVKPTTVSGLESDISADQTFFLLRNDIFPCTTCGEIFQKPHLLEQHEAIKHAVSEFTDGDSGKNIVSIIFKTGWSNKNKNPEIVRILKIHNNPKILSRFEEYREFVKAKAARNSTLRRRDERCLADGNELLRFYCSTFLCDLGLNGSSSICNQQYCSVCEIIKSGFSPKLDGISTLSTSWRAHVAIPEEIEEEFKFMNIKRAMLVCRVVAGRIGCDTDEDELSTAKEDGGFDSVIGRGASGIQTILDEEELSVFNPKAVLPCFVIVYTV